MCAGREADLFAEPRGVRDQRLRLVLGRRQRVELDQLRTADGLADVLDDVAQGHGLARADVHGPGDVRRQQRDQRRADVGRVEVVAHLAPVRARRRAAEQQVARDRADQPCRVLVRAEGEEDPRPGELEPRLPRGERRELVDGVLRRPVEGLRIDRRLVLEARAVAGQVLGARAGHHRAAPAGGGERAHDRDARLDPAEVLERVPHLAGGEEPRRVQEVRRRDLDREALGGAGDQQVRVMDGHPGDVGIAPAGHDVHLVAGVDQQRQRVAADEPRPSGDQDAVPGPGGGGFLRHPWLQYCQATWMAPPTSRTGRGGRCAC